jgi:hypothetical protein
MRLRCTGTTGGSTRNLIVPAIEKPYIVSNDCADSIIVKNATGTGITVPAGKTMWVYNNATNVVDAVTHLSSLTLGTSLPVSSGGTGTNTAFTAGSVVFAGASGVYTQDNANLFWDNSNDRLGIGTASPAYKLQAVSAGAGASEIVASNTLGGERIHLISRNSAGISYAQSQNSQLLVGTFDNFALQFMVNNTTRMIVDTSGNVGIGTNSPGTKLDIVGAGNPTLTLRGSDAAYSSILNLQAASGGTSIINATGGSNVLGLYTNTVERMRIDSSGNVGIGTSSPQRPLHVYYGSAVTGAYGAIVQGFVGGYGAGVSFQSQLSGGSLAEMARITADGEDAWNTTTSTQDAGLRFYTSLNGAVSEKMRINASGNVGIGTTAPQQLLALGNSTDQVGAGVTGAVSTVFFGTPTNVVGGMKRISYDRATGNLNFIDGSLASPTTQMAIDASGNVGIGTSSPGVKLDVAGDIRSTSGNYYAANGGVYGWGSLATYIGGSSSTNIITFQTNSSERMRIDSSGNVGIGSTSPEAKLKVRQDLDGTTGIIIQNRLNSGTPIAALRFITGSLDLSDDRYASIASGGTAAADLRFITSSGGPAERARIDSSGNLLVNTTTAIEKLTIGSTTATSSGINQRTTQTDFAIKPSNTAAGGVTLEVGWVAGGQGPLIFNLGGEKARIDSSGNLLVGTTATAPDAGVAMLSPTFTSSPRIRVGHTSGTASGNGYHEFLYAGSTIGSITQSGTTAVLYNTTSDARLKENIANADDAASLIDALQVRKFDWKADNSHQRYGFVAQELVEVAPEAVHQPEDPDEMMGVDYSKLVPMLVKEVQSLRARVAQLEGN